MSDDDARIPEHYAAEVARFFEAHARWLFGHACLRTGRDRELAAGRELAADLVQDTFEAAALAWETLRELSEAQQRGLAADHAGAQGNQPFPPSRDIPAQTG